MRGRSAYMFMAILLTTGACSSTAELVPGPTAQPAPEMPGGAVAEVAGIRVSAAAERWRGDPINLAADVTPVFVRVENKSLRPLAIRYQNIHFLDPRYRNYQIIPAFDMEATKVKVIPATGLAWRSFSVASHMQKYYQGARTWNDAFSYDSSWFLDRYAAWRGSGLPSNDMVKRSLPEGVLDPGGVVEGFVYFDRVEDDYAEISLNIDLVTAGGKQFGKIQIPFTAD